MDDTQLIAQQARRIATLEQQVSDGRVANRLLYSKEQLQPFFRIADITS